MSGTGLRAARMGLRPRIYKSVCALLLGLLAASPAALADERVLSFDSAITVNRDGTLEVQETIRVRAEGRNIRRGIYRDFPTTYPRAGGGRIVVGFDFQSATRDGVAETWRVEDISNGVRIYLGSASRTLSTGEHEYQVVYRTDHQVGYFADHDELYWNATGNGWGFAIDRASARVLLPDEIPHAEIRLEAYTGAQGAKGRRFTASLDNGAPLFTTTRRLKPQEGLTIVAMWPKGFIMPAVESTTATARKSRKASKGYDARRDGGESNNSGNAFGSPAEAFLKKELPHDNRPAAFGLTGLGLLIAYYYFIWNRVGRDPPSRVIIPEYELPARQSAASMRYLMRMGYDQACFAAAILSLAVKGYLRIEQSSGILGIGKSFTLKREPTPGKQPLSPDEQALFARLFDKSGTLELESENHSRVNEAREAHERSIEKSYKSGFFSINGGWHMLGILLSLFLIAITLSQPGASPFWPHWYLTHPLGWLTVSTAVAALVANGVFGKLLRAPTVLGQHAMDRIRGFRMYLDVAEGEALKRVQKPPPPHTPELYHAYLPAALALGVEQKWAERFARELALEPERYEPTWYSGPAWNPASVTGFCSQVGTSLSGAISSASEAPGSSSGGDGGGSSGGGGGGGGGGGW